MRKSLIGIVASLAISTASFACDIQGNTGFVEENNLWISTNAKSINTITEEKFNEVIDDISKIYAPIIAAKGKKLVVERKWDNGTVNAYAQQTGKTWKVSMFGGLARHEVVTADGFAFVVCHEIGHHLGGAPKKKSWIRPSWASNEGQSDFWAGAKCMKKYFEKEDNVTMMSKIDVPKHVTESCSQNFNNIDDQAMCERGAMAGLSLGSLFKALRNLRTDLSFLTPDTSKVSKTNDSHPAPQCRLDTYFQSSLCSVNPYLDVSDKDANKNICSRSNGHEAGVRPFCWYKAAKKSRW